MAHSYRFAAFAGMAAAVSMAATPAAAAEISPTAHAAMTMTIPIDAPGVFDAEAVNADRYRRYRGYRRGRVRTGDVLAGVLIIGGIAAIANAASNSSKNKRSDDYRNEDRRYRDNDYQDRRGDARYDGSRGIDGAVSQCVSRIERDVRVDTVDSVDRNGDGWRVTGSIFNGDRFTCRIGSDGKIDDVDYGSGFVSDASPSSGAKNKKQHSDDRYAAAWNAADRGDLQPTRAATAQADGVPAYPGGPLPGEELEGDDRYRTAEADLNN